MDSSIFLFILPYFFACTLAATSPTILLKSSEPTSWLNDNSINMNVNSTDGSKVRAILSRTRSLGFVCGFYCSTGSCTSYYFGIIVVGGGNPAMVWSAKPDNPENPVRENANLTLTREGGLVLQNADGSTVWSTGKAGISVAGMNLTELGNLVLFNETGAVVWQSFDYPTDTLLAGQRLYEDQRLVSGLYYATVTISGLAAFTLVGNGTGSQMYYQLKPEPNTTDQSSQRGRCPIITQIEVNNSDNAELQTRGFLENMGSNRSKLPLDLSVEYVRLNSDGSLKLYRHELATRANETVDMVTKDLGVCQHPRQCGDFGFCNEGRCGCPKGVKGFKWKNDRCARTTQLCQAPSDKADLDIKPQNILLDANFNAKISDFGLSKLVDRDNSQVLITLRGTPGYIAPECGHSNITIKVDIYSFGIVLLEIITGRRNLDGTRSESSKHLLSLMQKKAREDQLLDIVENLNEEMPENREEMFRMIRIAAWCLQYEPTKRPLMSTVVKVLEGVMEVDPSISYDFTHAMGSASVGSGNVSGTAQASVLSNPMQASVLSNPR